MKFPAKIVFALIAAMLATAANAEVSTNDIKVGTVLDASGVKMLGFGGSPLPFPPGPWEIVSRIDGNYALEGGTHNSAAKVDLTLRNTDPKSNIAAMFVTYSPDVTTIKWKNGPCESSKAIVVETNGTTADSLIYNCVKAFYNDKGGKAYVEKAAESTNPWVKANVAPLAPFLKDIPEKNFWISVFANRESGRTVALTMMIRANAKLNAGDAFDQNVRAWLKSTGSAVSAFLNKDPGVIGAFPSE